MPSLCKSGLPATICREFIILWRFIDNDIWDTICPSLIAFMTAWCYSNQSWNEFPARLGYSLGYAALYIYTFCLSNQVNGVEEDRINKPYRPLPTGLVTVKATWIRIVVYTVVYLLVAWRLHIFWYSLAWVAVTYLLNTYGWSNHWFTKNVLGMTFGTFILLNVQWGIAAPDTPASVQVLGYMALISVWAGIALPLQDMRDEQGDRKMGRRTLPITFGDKKARMLLFINFLVFSPALFLGAMLTQLSPQQIFSREGAMIILLLQIAIHWCISIRVVRYKTPSADNKTYHLYVALFCAGVPVICFL
ncbi:UbiA family prenyltransferase [Chitinophaga nivalis]|uniref:UbiA family prenyltransferase n=1 Tax=Chitinophaga nivalis TaxID=2991709 RepID=A0ABT3IIH2_9BACT|nr:UbiA family prenyltransferase [Chitinophaga nivalis]MCW3466760.1 UbiA family prenyltransferase [Chitinophaga nivalis]MCW3483549.1 UbiA family prenyltransferase [Chitinophaga nivalis]